MGSIEDRYPVRELTNENASDGLFSIKTPDPSNEENRLLTGKQIFFSASVTHILSNKTWKTPGCLQFSIRTNFYKNLDDTNVLEWTVDGNVNGVAKNTDVDWKTNSVFLRAGSSNVTWNYLSGLSGQQVLLDKVEFTSGKSEKSCLGEEVRTVPNPTPSPTTMQPCLRVPSTCVFMRPCCSMKCDPAIQSEYAEAKCRCFGCNHAVDCEEFPC